MNRRMTSKEVFCVKESRGGFLIQKQSFPINGNVIQYKDITVGAFARQSHNKCQHLSEAETCKLGHNFTITSDGKTVWILFV